MAVHEYQLVWKREDGNGRKEDVELGTCFHTVPLAVGELIVFASEHHRPAVWKVVTVYHQPFLHGSMTWRAWRERGEEPSGSRTACWVEPAEGPWEA